MNEREYLIYLSSCALRGEKAEPDEESDLGRVLSLARKHRIEALVFDSLPPICDPALLSRWEEYRNRSVIRETIFRDESEKLTALFDTEGIGFLFLKGTAIKKLYPEPYMRYMGDIDVLYDGADEKTITRLLCGIGYSPREKHDGELVFEKKPVIILEMHKKLCARGRAGAEFFNSFSLEELKNGDRAAELAYLYTVAHAAHHYNSGGTGIRNVIDIYLLSKTALDREYIAGTLKKLGLAKFEDGFVRLGVAWFDGEVMTAELAEIGDFILYSGVGGRAETRIKRARGKKSRAAYIASRLFPSPSEMQRIYPSLDNRPWLMPLYWAARPFVRLIQRPEKAVTELKMLNKENRQR